MIDDDEEIGGIVMRWEMGDGMGWDGMARGYVDAMTDGLRSEISRKHNPRNDAVYGTARHARVLS